MQMNAFSSFLSTLLSWLSACYMYLVHVGFWEKKSTRCCGIKKTSFSDVYKTAKITPSVTAEATVVLLQVYKGSQEVNLVNGFSGLLLHLILLGGWCQLL